MLSQRLRWEVVCTLLNGNGIFTYMHSPAYWWLGLFPDGLSDEVYCEPSWKRTQKAIIMDNKDALQLKKRLVWMDSEFLPSSAVFIFSWDLSGSLSHSHNADGAAYHCTHMERVRKDHLKYNKSWGLLCPQVSGLSFSLEKISTIL